MEIQITDFENTAFAIFIVLLTRAIISFNLNFYIPISKVDENMQNAHKRGAVLNEKFYFRKNVFTKQKSSSRQPSPSTSTSTSSADNNGTSNGDALDDDEDQDAYELMTINEIINGKVHGILHQYIVAVCLAFLTFVSLVSLEVSLVLYHWSTVI